MHTYLFSSLFVHFFVYIGCISNFQRWFVSLSFCFSNPKNIFSNKSKFHAIVHIIREGLLALFFVLYLSDLTRYEFFFGIFPGGGSCLAAKIFPHSPYTVHHHIGSSFSSTCSERRNKSQGEIHLALSTFLMNSVFMYDYVAGTY